MVRTNEKMVRARKKSEIIESGKKVGYELVIKDKFWVMVICPICKARRDKLLQLPGITQEDKNFLLSINLKTALVFNNSRSINPKRYSKTYACQCGWRKFIAPAEEKPKCITHGCNATLPKGRKAYCYKCKPYKGRSKANQTDKEPGSKVTM